MNASPVRRSAFTPALLIGGGIAALGAFWLATKKSQETVDSIERAVAGTDPPATSQPAEPGTGGVVNLRLTGYWPFKAGLTEAQRRMEGGLNDRKGRPLHTLEDHLADPVKHPYVSLAGDDAIWPYGQRIVIDAWPNAVFRVVDTGSNFRGANKVYRLIGHEPIDVCVNSSKTVVPKTVTAKIVPGDSFEPLRAVATGKIKNQSISGSVRDARTTSDYDALARAIESELSGRPYEEMLGAAWAMRNRAAALGVAIADMLSPNGKYGATTVTGGYASTRRAATDKSHDIASEVLDAPDHEDPTGGAIDFWVPEQQNQMRQLGDIYRAAAKSGDEEKATKYARYAEYGTEADVRACHAKDGLCVYRIVGRVELLGRME